MDKVFNHLIGKSMKVYMDDGGEVTGIYATFCVLGWCVYDLKKIQLTTKSKKVHLWSRWWQIPRLHALTEGYKL